MMAFGSLMMPTTLNSDIVLPEPDSPTMPTISRGAMRKEIPSTARTSPRSVRNETERSRTSSSAGSAFKAHPRIEYDIDEIDKRIGRDHKKGCVHHIGHDHRQIQVLERVIGQL